MRPQIYHVLSQQRWPGVRDVDDCWVIASLQAVHSVAPWLRLPGNREFRRHTGVQNVPTVDNPGMPKDMGAGIRGAFPGLKVRVLDGADAVSFATFATEVKRGRPAALIVNTANLPSRHQLAGFIGIHAITVAFVEGKWRVMNPLAKPHSKPMTIDEPDLKNASRGFSSNVHAVLMPTIDDALATHGVHAAQIAKLERQVKRLRRRLEEAGISSANI